MFRKILKALVIILLILIVLALFNYKKIGKLYHVITLFDKENIVDNFLNMEASFASSKVTKSPNPTRLPERLDHQLPLQFESKGQTYNTDEFLERTLTTGLMIIHKDTIVFENYHNGLTPETTHISWSMAKSFVSGMIGIALNDGDIESLDDPITKYLPQLKSSGYNNVKIKDILQMSSGVGFDEDYSSFNSDINRFGRYFAMGTPFEDFTLSLKTSVHRVLLIIM